jgi:hypothetical protein
MYPRLQGAIGTVLVSIKDSSAPIALTNDFGGWNESTVMICEQRGSLAGGSSRIDARH